MEEIKFNPTHKMIFVGSPFPQFDPQQEERLKKRMIRLTGKGSDGKELTSDVLKLLVGEIK